MLNILYSPGGWKENSYNEEKRRRKADVIFSVNDIRRIPSGKLTLKKRKWIFTYNNDEKWEKENEKAILSLGWLLLLYLKL